MTWRAEERRGLIGAARRTLELGLTHGTSGNVSARASGGMAITPTGMPYEELEPDDIVLMALDGTVAAGERRLPSSEWRMHAAIYLARPEVAAVVHGHSPAATAVACLGRDLPAFHYMVAAAGGDSVRCAPYALFGSEAIAAGAVKALDGRRACFLAQHGLMAIGEGLDEAVAVAVEVEFLAGVFLSVAAIASPKVLSAGQMREVLERFKSYGQQR